ncbi:MAG: HK97 gp10 family phage protein [Bryobacteraceae bacterium]|jgi:urease accessory protein UreF
MAIRITQRGSFKNTERFLQTAQKLDIPRLVDAQAARGAQALAAATPVRTSLAARSWGYEVRQNRGGFAIVWTNSDIENGFPVVIMLQYGHGTGTGGYVQGRDFINPAIRPIFDDIAQTVWKAVTSA